MAGEYSIFKQVLEEHIKPFESSLITASIQVSFDQYQEVKKEGRLSLSKYISIDEIDKGKINVSFAELKEYSESLFTQMGSLDRWFSYAHYGHVTEYFKRAGLNILIRN